MLDELPGELLAGEVLLVRLLLHGGVRILSEELLLVGLLVGLRLAGGVGLLTGEVLLAGDTGEKGEVLLLAVLAGLTGCSMGTLSSIISRE